MDNLKVAARLLNRELSKRHTRTCRRVKKAIMASASLGMCLGSLPCRGPVLTLFYSAVMP